MSARRPRIGHVLHSLVVAGAEVLVHGMVGRMRDRYDFSAYLLDEIGPTTTVIMSSDHGNMEDIGLRLHSTNPVPLLVVGPGTESFRQARSITDVAGGIMRVLAPNEFDV